MRTHLVLLFSTLVELCAMPTFSLYPTTRTNFNIVSKSLESPSILQETFDIIPEIFDYSQTQKRKRLECVVAGHNR